MSEYMEDRSDTEVPTTARVGSSEAAIEVEYELTIDDHLAFIQYHHAHSPSIMRRYKLHWWLLPAVFGPLGAVLALIGLGRFDPLWVLGVYFLLVSVAWTVIAPRRWRGSVRKNVRALLNEGSGFRARPCKVRIGPHGIDVECADGCGTTKWTAIDKIAEGDHHYYLTRAPPMRSPCRSARSPINMLRSYLWTPHAPTGRPRWG